MTDRSKGSHFPADQAIITLKAHPSDPFGWEVPALRLPGCIGTVGHQGANQQLIAVLSSNVKRSIAKLIYAVNLRTYEKHG